MTEARMDGQSPEQKLLTLGIPEKNIASSIAVLRIASSLKKLTGEFINRGFHCDEEQFLLPMFRPLYQREFRVRKATLEQLAESGIPEKVINDYFVNYGDQPYMILCLTAENNGLNEDAKDKLIEQAKQVMLTVLRDHLGFSPKDTATKSQ